MGAWTPATPPPRRAGAEQGAERRGPDGVEQRIRRAGPPGQALTVGPSPRWAELQELDEVGTTGQPYHHLKQLVAASWLQTAGRGRYAVLGNRVVPLLVLLAATHPEVG